MSIWQYLDAGGAQRGQRGGHVVGEAVLHARERQQRQPAVEARHHRRRASVQARVLVLALCNTYITLYFCYSNIQSIFLNDIHNDSH